MKKISALFILLFSVFPKAYPTKTSHLSEQDYEQIFSQSPSLKEELNQQNQIFALACLGKTELQHYDPNKLLITNPVSKRTILHYLAMFNHHQLLNSLLQKYHSLKQKINILDRDGFTPFHYAVINSSSECTQLLLPHSEPLTDQNEYDSIPFFDEESLENFELPDIKPLCDHTYPQCCSNIDEFSDDGALDNFVNDYITAYLNDPTLQKKVAPLYDYSNENDNTIYTYQASNNQLFNVKNHQPKSSETVKKRKKRGSKYSTYYNSLTKAYECPYKDCNKSYKESYHLGQHMKNQHKSEIVKKANKYGNKYDQFYNPLTKEYKCPECPKAFKHNNELADHMTNQHKGKIVQKEGKKRGNKYSQFYNLLSQAYECPYNDCNKSYKRGNELGQHMKNEHKSEIVKEGNKHGSKYDQFYNPLSQKYVCPYNDCNKSYTESNNLCRHMKNQHKSKIVKKKKKRGSKYDQFYNSLSQKYVCPYCRNYYLEGFVLGSHMKKEHNKIVKKDGTIKTIEIP